MSAWPLYDFRIETKNCVLKLPTEKELIGHVEGFETDVREFGEQGFLEGEWWKLEGDAFVRQFMQYQWHLRASWKSGNWKLPMGIFVEDRLVGFQTLRNTPEEKTIMWGERAAYTGSWLLKEFHGKGIGKSSRIAAASLAFELGFVWVISSAIDHNHASIGVSKSIGYYHYKTQGNKMWFALNQKNLKSKATIIDLDKRMF